MDPEGFVTPEVGVAVAVTGLLTSPRMQAIVRRGLVLITVGTLRAADGIKDWAAGLQGAPPMTTQPPLQDIHETDTAGADKDEAYVPGTSKGRSVRRPTPDNI